MDGPIRFQPEADGGERLPEALQGDLERLLGPGEPIVVPRDVDEQVARMARRRLSERVAVASGSARGLSAAGRTDAAPSRRRGVPRYWVGISAAAAAILVAVIVVPRFISTTPKGGGVASSGAGSGRTANIALRGDIDADGRVDIVDALLLAKFAAQDAGVASKSAALKQDQTSWDVNGDGVVDEKDALAIRQMIVKLEGGA